VSKEHAITELNPVIATMPSISGAGLPSFCIFLPWEDNFNSGRSWKRKSNHFKLNEKYLWKYYIIQEISTSPIKIVAATWWTYFVKIDVSWGLPGKPWVSTHTSSITVSWAYSWTSSTTWFTCSTSLATGAVARCLRADVVSLQCWGVLSTSPLTCAPKALPITLPKIRYNPLVLTIIYTFKQ